MENPQNSTTNHIIIQNGTGIAIGDNPSVSLQITKAKAEFTPADLFAAAQKITPQRVQDVLPRHNVIRRDRFSSEWQNFLESSARYAVITGAAGVGKSVVMATQARDLLADGWATFLIAGSLFSLDYLAEFIAKDGLGYVGTLEWRQVLIAPWQSQPSEPVKGCLLLIDALDLADSTAIVHELTRFHNANHHMPASRIKLVVSCHNFVWVQKHLPFFQNADPLNESSVRVIELSDFHPSELTNALHSISAVGLMKTRQMGGSADPHVESLHELLKHPAIFGLYAALCRSSPKPALTDISWSGLLVEYFQTVITRISNQCTLSTDFLQEQLILLVQMARRRKSRDFLLDKEMLRAALPELHVDDTDPRRSPYAAMCELGFLKESALPAGKRSVQFALVDAASYLLSLALERESAQERQTEAALEQTITDWLNESLNDFPLLDALLIWIDRLATKPHDRSLHLLLSKIIESHIVQINVAFRLLQPKVLEALFEIVAPTPLDHFYRYRDAAESLRFSSEMGDKARKRLYHHSSQVRQLALHYLGQNRDVASTMQLIELLEDEDRDTRECAYWALARIGEPALPSLLAVMGIPNESFDKRRRCLVAVRRIGIHNEEVSTMVSRCLQESLTTGDKQLLRSALQTASMLRDRRQVSYAIQALKMEDWLAVWDAAKLLTELPSVDALSALQDVFRRTNINEGDDMWQEQAARQILAAIVAIQTAETAAYTLEKFTENIKGIGGLHPRFALSVARKWNVPGVDSIVLETLLQSLENDPSGNSSGLGFDWLEQRWRPQQLMEIAQSAQSLQQQGKDIAKLTVDAIVTSEAVLYSHQLYDHHKRVDALHVLAKCQPSNFVKEVTRLLECPGHWHFDTEVCNALWVLADGRAEQALIHRLEQLMAQPETQFYEFTPVLRALGTSGSEQCLPLLIGYLKNAITLERKIPEQCLYPLVHRGQIRLDKLIEWVNDPHAQPSGRVAALVTLGMLNAKEYISLLDVLLHSTDEPLVLAYAARMAGSVGNSTSILHLRRSILNTRG